jgi:hypothetical protein
MIVILPFVARIGMNLPGRERFPGRVLIEFGAHRSRRRDDPHHFGSATADVL